MLKFQTAMSAIALIAAMQSGFAQQPIATKPSNDSSATGTRGSLVQQLRSLSDEALNTLQDAEQRAGVVAVQSQSPSPNLRVPGPPQPTGRAVLRRTNASPWLERFDQESPSQRQATNRTRESNTPVRASMHGNQVNNGTRQASVSRSNDKTKTQTKTPAKSGPTQFRLSDTTDSPRTPSTPRLLLGDSAPPNGPTPLPIPKSGRTEMAGPYPSQVEVLEQLPPSVRASLIGGSDMDASLTQTPQRDDQQSLNGLPPDALSSPESMEPQPLDESTAAPTKLVSETNRSKAPVGMPPKVSRIPLPNQQTLRREVTQSAPKSQEQFVAQQESSSTPEAIRSSDMPTGQLQSQTKEEATTFELDTPKTAMSPKPVVPKNEEAQAEDGIDATLPKSNSALPSQLTSSPKVPRNPVPLPAQVTRDSRDAEQFTAPELAQLPQTTVLSLQKDSATTDRVRPEPQPVQQRIKGANASPVGSDRIRSDSGNRQSQPPSSNARIAMDSPRLKVTFEGPQTLPVNEPASYNIIVHNSDVIPLHGIIVRMDVPAGVLAKTFQPTHGKMNVEKSSDGMTLLTWEFQALAGSDMAKAPVQFTAKESRNFPVAMEWTLIPMDASSQIDVLSPELKVALEGPAEVVFGQSNAYRLRVRNPGTADAKAVKLRLTAGQYGASEIDLGSIAPGGEEVVEVDLTFNESGSINIAAVASLDRSKSASSAIDVLVTQAELVASIQVPSVVYRGNSTRVLIDVTNQGNADASDTIATVEIPAGCVVSKIPTDASLDRNQLTWRIGKLTRGQKRSLEMIVDKMNEGDNEFRVHATNAAGLPAKFAAKTNVRAVADLKLLVNDPIAPAPVGGEVVYELTLTNRGSKAADNVKVLAQFSEGIEPIKAEGHPFRVVPGQVFFESIPRVEPGDTLTFKIYAKADRNGMHRFRAEVRSDDSDLKLVQEESTEYLGDISRTATTPTAPLLR